MAREVPHSFKPNQIRLIRYARKRWQWDFPQIADHYPEFFAKGTSAAERANLVELVVKGVLGAADDSMVELPAPPSQNSPLIREKKPGKCANGHAYHGEVCFMCYIASLPKPDAEAAEVK